MRRIKEFETACVRISMHEDKAAWYVLEVGLTDKNIHEALQTFQTKEKAENEYQRLQELLRDNGNAIMETIYKEPINA